jgi:hypothetical protein
MSTELFILCVALGAALAFALPSGVRPGTKYEANTEEEFEAYLRRSGLK